MHYYEQKLKKIPFNQIECNFLKLVTSYIGKYNNFRKLRHIHITRGLEQVVGVGNKEENNLIIIDNGSRSERRENLEIEAKAGINKLTAEIAHEQKLSKRKDLDKHGFSKYFKDTPVINGAHVITSSLIITKGM